MLRRPSHYIQGRDGLSCRSRNILVLKRLLHYLIPDQDSMWLENQATVDRRPMIPHSNEERVRLFSRYVCHTMKIWETNYTQHWLEAHAVGDIPVYGKRHFNGLLILRKCRTVDFHGRPRRLLDPKRETTEDRSLWKRQRGFENQYSYERGDASGPTA